MMLAGCWMMLAGCWMMLDDVGWMDVRKIGSCIKDGRPLSVTSYFFCLDSQPQPN